MDKSIRVGSVLSRSFRIYARNFPAFMILLAVIFSPLAILVLSMVDSHLTADESTQISWIVMGGGFFLSVIAAAAVTFATFEQLRGRRASMAASAAVGLRSLVPALLVGMLMILGIGLGFVALVVPGVVWACMWFVAIPVTVVEKPGVFASLARSRALTKGSRWQIFFAVFLLNLATQVIARIMRGAMMSDPTTISEYRTFLIAFIGVMALLAGITAVVTCVVYHDLRKAKDGVDTDELASVFE